MSDVSRRDVLQAAVGAIGAAVGAALLTPNVNAAGQLSSDDIIRAWKDEEFRRSLTDQQRAQLPAHPSGSIELSARDDSESRQATRGRSNCTRGNQCKTCRANCCSQFTCGGR